MDQKKKLPPSQTADKYIVRLPDGMRDRIAEQAKTSGRTMNAEIIARLQASFEPAPSADGAVAKELADSRGQTIRAMVIIQKSLCEAVQRMYGSLAPREQRDRNFEDAAGLATGLLEGARPAEYLLPRAEMKNANPDLALGLEDALTHEEAESKRVRVASLRPRRTNVAKR
jgi:hypothetical protein